MASSSSSDTQMRPAQIDFYLRKVVAPKYKMLRVPMNNSSSGSVSVGATDSQPIEFKLPGSKVYNLSRSFISYVQTLPAVALVAPWMFQDMFSMGNAITFGSAGGNDLVNLQYANNYSKINRRLHTPTDELLSNSNLSGLYRHNGDAATNYVPGGNAASFAAGLSLWAANDNYLEPKYADRAAIAAAKVEFRQYPLGATRISSSSLTISQRVRFRR